jgi:hypothetical protein
METKLKIIETPDYILAVSDEDIEKWYLDDVGTVRKGVTWDKEYWSVREDYKKIIAYQPKGNAPELDLPLLPKIVVEDDVEKLAKDLWEREYKDLESSRMKRLFISAYIQGYKAATRVYSEEDLREALDLLCKSFDKGYPRKLDLDFQEADRFIQSLKQPKTPKWFVAETEINYATKEKVEKGFIYEEELKTTTINGKEYLVGTYLYE